MEPEKHFWKRDPGDDVLPHHKGFISDCVYRHRGKEVTTLFTIWSSLFVISSAVKREAWLKFGNKRLFTNFYYILVGPAGIAHKTEAINDAIEILEGFGKHIKDPVFSFMKAMNIVSDKSTPEALLEALLPRNKEPKGQNYVAFKDGKGNPILDPSTGRPRWYSKTAESALVAHEFATFAGQQKYNTGLTDNLLALYDCDRPFTWRTIKNKKRTLNKLHTTLIAGATVESFRSSLSENVKTAGFLSRSVMVYCPRTVGRRFSRPQVVEGAPCEEELQKRLAWIAEHAVGEFDLSPEADRYYDKWYCKWREDLENDTQYQGARSRLHIFVLKVALLLRLQRYEVEDPVVSLQDIKDAIMLIKKTWFDSLPLMRGFESAFAKPFVGRLEDYIRDKGECNRMTLLKNGHFEPLQINEGITMLCEEGKVEIHSNGAVKNYPSRDTKEVYRWIGEKWLGCSEDE